VPSASTDVFCQRAQLIIIIVKSSRAVLFLASEPCRMIYHCFYLVFEKYKLHLIFTNYSL